MHTLTYLTSPSCYDFHYHVFTVLFLFSAPDSIKHTDMMCFLFPDVFPFPFYPLGNVDSPRRDGLRLLQPTTYISLLYPNSPHLSLPLPHTARLFVVYNLIRNRYRSPNTNLAFSFVSLSCPLP